MSKNGYSRKGAFGQINHYDENGHKVGESWPSLFGGMNEYDENGKKVGYSTQGLFGGYNHYDESWHNSGYTPFFDPWGSGRNIDESFDEECEDDPE